MEAVRANIRERERATKEETEADCGPFGPAANGRRTASVFLDAGMDGLPGQNRSRAEDLYATLAHFSPAGHSHWEVASRERNEEHCVLSVIVPNNISASCGVFADSIMHFPQFPHGWTSLVPFYHA